ncbi:MAG: carbon storage regulator [Longimicrobiales bacterium]
MLILTRRAGEAILIEGGVRIVVLGTEGGGVRLGIEAPPSVGIVREEVMLRGAEEKPRVGAGEGGKDGFQPSDGSADASPRSAKRGADEEKEGGE